jgi:hypothetical protein
VAFTFRVVRNRQLVAVFEEQRDTRGKAHLVAWPQVGIARRNPRGGTSSPTVTTTLIRR